MAKIDATLSCLGARSRARHINTRVSIAAAFVAVFVHSTALAHDPPQGTGVFAQDASVLVRTNRGLMISADGATDFRLLCNEALDINTAEVPSIVALRSGRWLLATSHGALIASADLCAFEPAVPLDAIAIPALAADPANAERILASTGQSDYDNGLFLSADDASSFSTLGDRDKNRLYDSLLIAPSDSQSLFAAGLRINEGVNGFEHFFAVSSDGGQHFTEHAFVLHEDEYAIEVLGISNDAGTLYAVAHADLGTGVKDRFLISTDGATSFRDAFSVDKLEAFTVDAISGDLLIAARDGLWRSTDAGSSFEQLQRGAAHCLAWTGRRLYVCEGEGAKAGLSVSDDGGETLTPLMRFTDVVSTVSCGANTVAHTACAGPWFDWQRELQLGFVLDGGVPGPDAAAADSGSAGVTEDAGLPTTTPMKDDESGCSCTTLRGASTTSSSAALLLQAVALLVVARRSRKRSRARSAQATSAHAVSAAETTRSR